MKKTFRCLLIGETNLLLHCAKFCLASGHEIVGICSVELALQEFAAQHDIPYFSSINNLLTVYQDLKCDYLFSIINETLLPSYLIQHPERAAINFHDSQLPRYAGMNAVPWVILNQEREHAVTWHYMETSTDTGNILVQSSFAVSAEETSLSLYMKCYEHAVESFAILCDLLCADKIPSFPQDLSQRTYYPISQKPKADAFIDWQQPAEKIERLFRATQFGHIKNRLTVCKLLLPRMVLVPHQLLLTNHISEQPPGTVLFVNKKRCKVATASYVLILEKISNLEGEPIVDLTAYCQVGMCLPTLSEKFLQALQSPSYTSYRNEKKYLALLENFLVSTAQHTIEDGLEAYQLLTQFSYSQSAYSLGSETLFLTAILFCLYRMNDGQPQGIAVCTDKTLDVPSSIACLFQEFIPFFVPIMDEMRFSDCLMAVSEHWKKLLDYPALKREIFIRFPILQSHFFWNAVAVIIKNDSPEEIKKNILSRQKFPIVLHIQPSARRIYLYSKVFGTAHVIISQLQCFKELLLHALENCLNQQQKTVGQVDFLPQIYADKILKEWNNTAFKFEELNILQAVFHQALKKPMAIALVEGERELTYEALVNAVLELSAKIRPYQTEEPFLVGIAFDKTFEYVIAVLASLLAGAAYVPLDLHHPRQHHYYVLQDAAPSLCLTNKTLPVFQQIVIPTLQYHYEIKEINSPIIPSDLSAFVCEAGALAYIMYTSGSTGKPKGVAIQHIALHNFLWDMKNRLLLSETEVWLSITTPSFDIVGLEIFLPLMLGAKLVLGSNFLSLDPQQFIRSLERHDVRVLQATPATWQILFDYGWQGKKNLIALVGGDRLSENLAKKMINCLASCWHLYGPTETTIWSVAELLPTPLEFPLRIGRPIANTALYILDRNCQILPPGCVGELYIAGRGLARAYHHLPELTQSKFIANPYYPTYTAYPHLYKTGDLAYWDTTGRVVFIGRKDFQVKLNGHRIELLAIEEYLYQYPGIKTAFVTLHQTQTEGARLIAYLQIEDLSCFDIKALMQFLKDHLPYYMLPTAYYALENLQFTKNMKLDRKNLPDPALLKDLLTQTYVSPRTDREKALVRLWEKLLNRHPIGINDNFFLLGGSSLLLTSLLLEVEKIWGVHFSFAQFIKNPTILFLSYLLSEKSSHVDLRALFPIIEADLQLENLFQQKLMKNSTTNAFSQIFLTGASGFLGTFLLQTLLIRYPAAHIYCLVRAEDEQAAEAKLHMALCTHMHYSLEALKQRVTVLNGDITLPQFALSDELFLDLSKKIDTIIHNAALVHHLYDYHKLRAANVQAVKTILTFAATHSVKAIHFISTLAAAPKDETGFLAEKFEKDINILRLQSGYALSKWVAEYLCVKGVEAGLPIKIYRAPWITGESKQGQGDMRNNQFFRLMAACIALKAAPDWDICIDLIAVDETVNAILTLAETDTENTLFNLSNPYLTHWYFIVDILREYAPDLIILSASAWREKLAAEATTDNPLYALLSLYLQWQPQYAGQQSPLEIARKTDCTTTLGLLEKCDLRFSEISRTLLRQYLANNLPFLLPENTGIT